jgi:CRISPR-associated endonuclease/helicase Cas3
MSNETKSSAYIAHVKQLPDGTWLEHALEDHLRKVGDLAAVFATSFASDDWARVAGYWHDLGKYRSSFQRYIRTVSGYDRANAHIETSPGRVDHSTAGAIYAKQKLDTRGHILAYLIAGHHAGLPDWNTADGGGSALSARLTQEELLADAMASSPNMALLNCELPTSRIPGGIGGFALWVRMLFSCLVDADFLDTEQFMDEKKSGTRADYSNLSELNKTFNAHMFAKTREATASDVNAIRASVLAECRAAANESPGIFTLTVPTGGGKTLSSMAFALDHATKFKKRRIIYVIPFTSIIEQTANIFREIFGDAVIEHHSNSDEAVTENNKSRLACENWDAPIIVTTNVQFFESLFAARTSRCRKLHNIVGSIVVLDEAQLIPAELRAPILDAMNLLATYYGITFVLSTATQPVLVDTHTNTGRPAISKSREIIRDPNALFAQLERVRYELPVDVNVPTTWENIAAELADYPRVLCVVNSRRDCLDLHALMPEGTICLSALMCGQHRSAIIETIKATLKSDAPIRVISTQLVEAGVDIDFPVVYRALAGLDSIAQAGGRCNREGKLEIGLVKVFVPPKPAPLGMLRKAVLAAGLPATLPPASFTQYFRIYFADIDQQKGEEIRALLTVDKQTLGCAFRSAAAAFKLIDDEAQRAVYVQYGESTAWLGILASKGPERWLLRKLQRYSVSISVRDFDQMLANSDVIPLWQGGFFAISSSALYGEKGLITPNAKNLPAESLVA